MPLTQHQIDALPVLDWLLGVGEDQRRGGRTTALAIGIIRAACRTPGRAVPFLDHYANTSTQRHMMFRVVEGMVMEDPRLATLAVWPDRIALRLDLPRPLLDWLPTADWLGPMPTAMLVIPPEPEPEIYRPSVWERLMTQLF